MDKSKYFYKIVWLNADNEDVLSYTEADPNKNSNFIKLVTKTGEYCYIPYTRVLEIYKSDEYIAPIKGNIDKFVI